MPWEGKVYRSGAIVSRTEFSPIANHVLAIECIGAERAGWGHRRMPTTYILWSLAPGEDEWREIARASSLGSEWTRSLHAAALAFTARESLDPRVALDAAQRVIVLLEYELDKLDKPAERADLCARLHDRVMYRLLDAQEIHEKEGNCSESLLYFEQSRPI